MRKTSFLAMFTLASVASFAACGGSDAPNQPDEGTTASSSSAASSSAGGATTSSAAHASASSTASSGGAASGGGGAGGAGGSFVTAPHGALPQVPNNGGRILADVQLVTVTFPGYTYESDVQGFDDWIVGSSWLTTVGEDYGVGAGTNAGHVVLGEAAPDSTTDMEIQQWLADRIGDGTLPAPATSDNDMLYVLYYPETTQIDLGGGVFSCTGFGGYHNSVDTDTLHVSYAVVPLCTTGIPDPLVETELAASHEIIEAATDAAPLTGGPAYQINSADDPWTYVGGEVGDLCVGLGAKYGNYVVTRVWSNQAAAMGMDPCVPQADPYWNVSISPPGILTAKAGTKLTIDLEGWSSAPAPDWSLISQQIFGSFMPIVTFGSKTLNNGLKTTATIDIPAGTPSGSYAAIEIFSIEQFGDTSVAAVIEVE